MCVFVYRLVGEAERLVSPDEMGTVYKALAVTALSHPFVPAGFAPPEGTPGEAGQQ